MEVLPGPCVSPLIILPAEFLKMEKRLRERINSFINSFEKRKKDIICFLFPD